MTQTAARPSVWKEGEKRRVVCPECEAGVDICFNSLGDMIVTPHHRMPGPETDTQVRFVSAACYGSEMSADDLEIFEPKLF